MKALLQRGRGARVEVAGEVVGAIDRGLLVQSLSGVHSGVNAVSGDFSVGAEGLLIRDGELAEPIRECITPERTYALQLLVYLFAYMKQHPEADAASAAILPLQRPSQVDGEFLSMRGGIVIERSQLPAIELLLTALVDELCDPDTPFAHREQSRYCRVCVGLVS